jgi:hypothetical protein
MIKRLFTTVLSMLFLFHWTYAQTSPPILTEGGNKTGTVSLVIGTVSGTSGHALVIPVDAQNFASFDVGAFSLKIGYDNTQLTFTGITPHQSEAGWVMTSSGGILTIVNSAIVNPVNDGLLLELKGVYNGTGIVPLEFLPGTEITGDDFVSIPGIFVNGEVMPSEPPAKLSIGKVIAPIGNTVIVPVNASGFGGDLVGSITLKIGFPNGVLIYNGLTPHQGFSGSSSVSQGQITFVWNSTSGQQINDGLLLELSFNYLIDEKAPVLFNQGVEIVDTDQSIIPVHYISGFVNTMPDGYTVSGILKYANEAGTPLTNSTVELWDEDGNNLLETTTTDTEGNYEFVGIIPGNYQLKADTEKPWGGVDQTDAFLIVGIPESFAGIFFVAADVNQSSDIDQTDAFIVYGRTQPPFEKPQAWTAPDWVFENPGISIIASDMTIDILGLCSGDVDASYDPIP